ncbi:MAG: hypothetical protein ACLGGV_05820 [Bacteroidia bacterium]
MKGENIVLEKIKIIIDDKKLSSPLFKVNVVIRLIFILFLLFIMVLDGKFGSESKEIVSKIESNTMRRASRGWIRSSTKYSIITNKDKHTVYTNHLSYIAEGDEIVVVRNIFGKPVSYYKEKTKNHTSISINRLFYVVLLFILISFGYYAGSYKYRNIIILLASFLSLISLLFYFIY